MIQRVRQYIRTHALLRGGEHVVVALSGGADSVALLRAAVTLGYDVEAAHCNFHLRGDESDRDENFVRRLCGTLGVRLHIRHFDTIAEARQTGKSIEMAARDLRYDWFASFGCAVLVAHHKDDNAETLLLNLIRGSGLAGLAAMAPMRQLGERGRVVRPLLCVTRGDILRFLDTQPAVDGLRYVTDSTNLEDEARRNVIRHHLVPLMATLNPNVVETLNDTSLRMREASAVYNAGVEALAADCFDGYSIDMCRLMSTVAPQSVLYSILSPRGFNNCVVDCILRERDGRPGAVYESVGWRLLRDRGRWLLRSKSDKYDVVNPVLPADDGVVQVARDVCLRLSRHDATGYDIPCRATTCCLDIDTLCLPLTVRLAQDGDRFQPFGMKGDKLVSDYLTDRHVNLFDKERQLVLMSGDRIAWLVGHRPAAPFAITKHTRRVLQIDVCAPQK